MQRNIRREFKILLISVLASCAPASAANNLRIGDLFVAVGNGQYRVYSNTGSFKKTISDGLSGSTGGCGFDSTYHLWTTNISNATVLRYKIDPSSDDSHGVLQTIAVKLTGGGPSGGAGSMVFDDNGNFYVGNPDGDGSILRYKIDKVQKPPTYVFDRRYVVELENGGSNWIDITDDEKILYTSEGRSIKQLDPSNNALADFANLGSAGGSNVGLFALRVLPDRGVVVADRRNIKRLIKRPDGSVVVVQTYDVAGQNDWRFLTLDPTKTSLWAGDATTGKVYKLNIETGAIEVGPVNVQSGSLSGLCVDGGFSAAQASPSELQPQTVTPETTRFDFEGSKLITTLNGLTASVSLRAWAAFIHKDAGYSDNWMPCTTTAPNGDCIVWNVEATLESFSSADVQIFQPNTDMNTRVLKNEAIDITTFVKNIDPGGRTRTFSVFSLNQAPVTGNAVSCGYLTPDEGSVYNLGSNLSFRFQAARTAVDCEKGLFLSNLNLEARLSLVRLVEGRAPEQVEVRVVGISDAPPIYRVQADGKTYHLNVKTTNLPAGDYLATTFDDSRQIPAFEVQFTLR